MKKIKQLVIGMTMGMAVNVALFAPMIWGMK